MTSVTTGKMQKALGILSVDGPYTVISIPIPSVGPKEILVKVEATGLNPADWKIPRFIPSLLAFEGPYPHFTGTDGAGTIVEVGSEVESGLVKGDRVVFQGWSTQKRTSCQQYTLVQGDLAVKIPSTMSFLEACTLPLALCTAAFGFAAPNPPFQLQPSSALPEGFAAAFPVFGQQSGGAGRKAFWEDDAENSAAGEPIVILGGSSSVGQFTIQIAKYLGHSPIITTTSMKHADFLKELGATHVIDRYSSEEELRSQINNILNEVELLLVFDTVDSPNLQLHIDYLSPNGIFVNARPATIRDTLVLTEGRQAFGACGSVHFLESLGVEMYKNLGRFLEKKIIKPTRIEKLSGGLAGIPEGLQRLEENKISGLKLVADPWETPE